MATLLLTAAASFVGVGFLGWVGWVVSHRAASTREARLAAATFGFWWYALAITAATAGVTSVVAAFGEPPLTLVVGFEFLNVAVLGLGYAALLFYLVFLATGRTAAFWPLAIVYSVGAGALLRLVATAAPIGLEVRAWEVAIAYAAPPPAAALATGSLLVFGPQLAASLALFALARQLPHSAGRVRLLVVASAIFAWFGTALVANAAGADEAAVWRLLERFVPVLVGLAVLLAYRPPPWLADRMPPELAPTPTRLRVRGDLR